MLGRNEAHYKRLVASAVSDTTHVIDDIAESSMAAPLVAGAAALYLQEEPWITPDEVWRAICDDTAKGVMEEDQIQQEQSEHSPLCRDARSCTRSFRTQTDQRM
jgi:uncharacterized Fe-S cluster protein YjdI